MSGGDSQSDIADADWTSQIHGKRLDSIASVHATLEVQVTKSKASYGLVLGTPQACFPFVCITQI